MGSKFWQVFCEVKEEYNRRLFGTKMMPWVRKSRDNVQNSDYISIERSRSFLEIFGWKKSAKFMEISWFSYCRCFGHVTCFSVCARLVTFTRIQIRLLLPFWVFDKLLLWLSIFRGSLGPAGKIKSTGAIVAGEGFVESRLYAELVVWWLCGLLHHWDHQATQMVLCLYVILSRATTSQTLQNHSASRACRWIAINAVCCSMWTSIIPQL